MILTIFHYIFQIFGNSDKIPKLFDFMYLVQVSFLLQFIFQTDYLRKKIKRKFKIKIGSEMKERKKVSKQTSEKERKQTRYRFNLPFTSALCAVELDCNANDLSSKCPDATEHP